MEAVDRMSDGMKCSPLDNTPEAPAALVQLKPPPGNEWVPSRFNARTVADDGRIILWNTFTQAVSVVEARHRDALEQYLSQKGFKQRLSGLAQYLYDRGYIVQKGTDELRRLDGFLSLPSPVFE